MDRWDENNKAENASCGHPYDSFAYLNSDNCARCDVADLIEVLDEM